MTQTKRTRLKRFLGYPAFFMAAFSLMLFLTFPYEVIGEQARIAARKSRIDLSIGSIGPGLFGIRAKDVRVTLPRQPGQAAEPEPIRIDAVSVRPALLPPGVKYSVKIFGGSIEGSLGLLGKNPKLDVNAKGLDLTRANAKAAVGLDIGGRLNGVVKLTLDKKDTSKTTGRIALSGDGVIINGGTVANIDLPRVDLGHLEAALKLDQGKAAVETFRSQGADVESELEGDITLAQKLAFSTLKLKLRFKPSDDFLRKNSFIQSGLAFAMSKDSRGFYSASIERMLGNPSFKPIR
jgi:type II secretion system protein N